MAVAQPGPLARATRAIGSALLDAVVPRRCGLCGRFDTFLCAACADGLPVAATPRCSTCLGTLDGRGRCRGCASVLVHSVAGVRSPYQLDGGARRLVHALKYDGLSALAEPMGRLMADCLADWGIRPELVVPVPLHRARERWRGFNQAALLARSCAEAAGLPVASGVLQRTRATMPQVRTSGAEERRRNVAGAFRARGAAARTLLLIDDVCTTGATLRACADALRTSGVERVYGLTFAHEG